MKYVISKPSVELMCGIQSHLPGLKIELNNDKSLIEFQHFYYTDNNKSLIDIEDEVTQIVGIKPDEIDKVIEALKDIKSKIIKPI